MALSPEHTAMEIIYCDLHGPFNVRMCQHKIYWAVFTDLYFHTPIGAVGNRLVTCTKACAASPQKESGKPAKSFFRSDLMSDRLEMQAMLPPPKECIALVVAAVNS
jgi:hypothetical protein